MHPMDCSLDASFHENGQSKGPSRCAGSDSPSERRRTSLDNSSLLASESVMLEILKNNSGSVHGDYDNNNKSSGSGSNQPRRGSFDNEKSVPITFLADTKTSSHTPKVDLDRDFHTNNSNGSRGSFRRSPNQLKKNSVTPELPSLAESLPLENMSEFGQNEPHSVLANSISDDASLNDDDEDLGDEDSFCEATGREMGNKAYIVQELGASFYFNDEEFFNHHVKPHVVTDDDAASLDEIIEEEVIIETFLPPASSHKSPAEITPTLLSIDKAATDDDSDCDSFCDAHGTDVADQKYLEIELGASCYWEVPTLAGARAQSEMDEKPAKNVDTIGEGDEDDCSDC